MKGSGDAAQRSLLGILSLPEPIGPAGAQGNPVCGSGIFGPVIRSPLLDSILESAESCAGLWSFPASRPPSALAAFSPGADLRGIGEPILGGSGGHTGTGCGEVAQDSRWDTV